MPSAPTIGTATGGDQQATVTWTAPGSNGGWAITGYEVSKYVGADFVGAQTFNSAATSQVVTGLTNGTAYTFKVAAINAVGRGETSNASNEVTPGAVPGAPTIGVAEAGNTQATVTWTAPASDGGLPITGYVVTPFIGASAQTARTFNSPATSQVVTGLTNGTAYTFRVAATNSSGTGAASASSNSVTPSLPTVPGAPTIGVATAGNTQATVTWTAPASNGASTITGYVVTPFIGAAAQTARTFNSPATSQVVTGLTNGTAYTFKVAAINGVGTGALSGASNVVTPSGLPSAPTIVAATPGNAQVTLTWTAPVSNGGSPITGYVVTPFIGATTMPSQTFNSPATTQVVTGLFNGAPYRFTVAAITVLGTGAPSAESNTVTPSAVPTATVSGTVRDGANQPVKGVVVEVPGYEAVTTDASGTYSVPGVALGTNTVQAEGICRAPVSQSVDLAGDATVDLVLGGFVTACSVDAQVWDATTTALPLTTSDTATAVALPFTVTRNGTPRTTAYVSSNGVVNFIGLDTSSANTALPNPAAPNDAIYGFWDHLQLDGSSAVLANTFGTAPNRRFVIEYRNVAIYDDPALRFSFQIVLYEDPNQRIRLQYRGNTAGTFSAGTSATVGHENAAGNSAQQVSYHKGLLFDGLSVRPK